MWKGEPQHFSQQKKGLINWIIGAVWIRSLAYYVPDLK